MSRPLRERLVELNRDTEPVRLAPAAEVRARGRQRARRRLAGTAVGVTALVAAAGLGAAGVLGPGGDPGPVTTRPTGPIAAAACAYPVDLALPDRPGEFEIKVVSASADRANHMVGELTRRSFNAIYVGDTDAAPDPDGTATVLRYGPSAIGAATLVRALVGGHVVMEFQPARGGSAVDLVLGPGLNRLASTTELNQALSRADEPTRPPGC